MDITVTLVDGSPTDIASATHTNISTSWVDGSFTLTAGEADNIDDFAMALRILAIKQSGARTGFVDVSWAEFEVPDVASAAAPPIYFHPA